MDEQLLQNKKPAQSTHSMVEIFVNLFSFILLGIVATSLGVVFFQIINKYFFDPLAATERYYNPGAFNPTAARYGIASLVVSFPIYIWALWFWFRSFKNNPEKTESRINKWLNYIILLAAAGTIVGDLIGVIYNFLEGELTTRFILKALSIFVIAVLGFGFYFFERKKIQYKREVSKSVFVTFFVVSTILTLTAFTFGFIASGTPGQERLRKFDQERVNNLAQISQGISNFVYDNNRLPTDFGELKDNPRYNYYISKTTDPETEKEYEYKALPAQTGAQDFEYELCAQFNLSTLNEAPPPYGYYAGNIWAKHDKGKVCKTQKATLKTPPVLELPRPLP